MKFAWIQTEKASYPLTKLCRWLGVTPSGFYAWQQRPESTHEREDRRLKVRVQASFAESKQRYGSPRIHEDLIEQDEQVSRKRVIRLMQEGGLKARTRKRFTLTTMSDHDQPVAANLLDRQFDAAAPNQRWVGDTTEFVIGSSGKLYLAVVLDLFSRFAVGWAVSAVNDRHLTIKALEMALKRRCPEIGLLHHSDKAASTPRWPSALAAGNGASRYRWVRSAIASTMRWPRASSRPWSASCSTERRCQRTPKHGRRCSSSSRGGTTHGGVTPRSATGRHWSSNGSIRPALWTVPGLWTPYGRPQVRWIPRCARDPHRPQESMLMYTP